MVKRNWHGNPKCYFCHKTETAHYLFFECTVARVVWGCVAHFLGVDIIPRSVWQYFIWIGKVLPRHRYFFVERLGGGLLGNLEFKKLGLLREGLVSSYCSGLPNVLLSSVLGRTAEGSRAATSYEGWGIWDHASNNAATAKVSGWAASCGWHG